MCVSLRRAEKTEVLSEDLLQVNMDFSLTHTCIRFQWNYIIFPGVQAMLMKAPTLACWVCMSQHVTSNVSCHDFT